VFHSGILDTTENGWDALYQANLRHVYVCTQRVARGIAEQHLSGSTISVTSIEGVRAAPGSEKRFGLVVPTVVPATSMKWPVPQCSSHPTSPATSPVRRFMSTVAPRQPAAGTTTLRPASMRSGPRVRDGTTGCDYTVFAPTLIDMPPSIRIN
jgi:NAD(P)-dependent dehydrogenase (short-subunit alcohol dehydrogenase family)